MKKKILYTTILFGLCSACLAVGFTSCTPKQGERGEAGAGIAKVEMVNGLLVVTLTDGTVLEGIEIPKSTTENLSYQKIKGQDAYRVVGMGNVSDYNVVIPEKYNDLPVTEIAEYAFAGETYIESVTIPDTVTSIGEYAFV